MRKKMMGEVNIIIFKSKVELSRFPPYSDVHVPHVYRVNSCVALLKGLHKPLYGVPKP